MIEEKRKSFSVKVTQDVTVTLKEEAFTEEFMEEFRQNFFDAHDLDQHAAHIAQLVARGLVEEVHDYSVDEFVEGYGKIKQFVYQATVDEQYDEVDAHD